MALADPKDALRQRVLAARAALSEADWAAEDAARDTRVLAWLADRRPESIAVYASRPGEPSTTALIDALDVLGWRVLLPVIRREADWAWFTSWAETVPGWGGIPKPTGQRLGAAGLAAADLILVPALAVGRDLTRLGTGGGWYDRALLHRRNDAPVVALTRAAEVIDTVPTLPHDQPVDGWISENASAVG